MSIFASIESETIVQELDRLRLSAFKSFIASQSTDTAITKVEIRPSKLGTYQDVGADLSTPSSWYLDWQYSFVIEIDALNNKIDFQEGSTKKVATLTTGTYTPAALATEIGTRMTAAGNQTYTASFGATTRKMTITGATSVFTLLTVTGTNLAVAVWPDISFNDPDEADTHYDADSDVDLSGAKTYTGEVIDTVKATASVRITNAAGTATASQDIAVIATVSDKLASTDADLKAHESGIIDYLPDGKSTFKYAHRRAQTKILEFFDREGYVDAFDAKLTKYNFVDTTELKEWSTYMSLSLIFFDMTTKTDDIFYIKFRHYQRLADDARDRAVLRLDINNDGTIDKGEQDDVRSCIAVRR